MRTAYLEGSSVASLARGHDVSRGAIRPAAAAKDAPIPELLVTLDMPGKVADFLRTADLEPAERATLDQSVTVRRGQAYTLRVSASPAVHRQLLDRCQPLDNAAAIPAQRKARREYANRVSNLDQ
ncbi:resolvase [Streptomyces sp. NPDC046876]|uniref:resolvase n=1 Tax=Streptomyces sp. NPDC046876 TaxID=3155616 RepID=UPI0033F15B51